MPKSAIPVVLSKYVVMSTDYALLNVVIYCMLMYIVYILL